MKGPKERGIMKGKGEDMEEIEMTKKETEKEEIMKEKEGMGMEGKENVEETVERTEKEILNMIRKGENGKETEGILRKGKEESGKEKEIQRTKWKEEDMEGI